MKNHTGVHRRALGAPLRPPFGASRLTPASAPPLGPGGVPTRDFQCCPPIVKKCSATQHGSPSYSAKSTLLSQKQRRYAYDSDVYAKNWTYLPKDIHKCFSFVIILKHWDRRDQLFQSSTQYIICNPISLVLNSPTLVIF